MLAEGRNRRVGIAADESFFFREEAKREAGMVGENTRKRKLL